ncbi:tail assembly chaperone [Microbacterium phage phiMiGM15]
MEADLQRFHGVDLAGLWRGELTIRRLSVLVHHLPGDGALKRLGMPASADGWTVNSFLLADVIHALTGKPHPARPEAMTRTERYKNLRARLEEQRARLTS